MKVNVIIPYRTDKDLGKAYNEAMQLIPDSDWACLIDHDVMFLTPDAISILHEYAKRYPDKIMTSYTNRIHPLSEMQMIDGTMNKDCDIDYHMIIAEGMKNEEYTLTPLKNYFSGFLILLSKKMWLQFPFIENGGCLGVDSEWYDRLRKNGKKIYRMNRLYVWHSYRLKQGIENKQHLL